MNRRARALLPLVVAFLLAPSAAAGALAPGATGSEPAPADTTDLFTVDDAIDLVEVGAPRLSPDGRRVVFARSELDWEDNERDRRLWVVDADGENARPYSSEEGDAAPRWSPDGRWLAFLRSAGGDEEGGDTRQIFLLPADGGEARQLTEHVTSVEEYRWGPDGERIFFAADDSLPDEEEERREAGYDAVFVNEGPNGQVRHRWTNLWSVAARPDSGEARPVTEGERAVGDFAVGPEGRRIAFTFRTEQHRNDANNAELAVVPADGGEIRVLTDNDAPESDPAWSPDGETLTFMAPDREEWRLDQGNLYAMDPESGTTRQLLADFQPAIGDYRWSPDGESLLFTALDSTTSDLYRLRPGSGEPPRQLSRHGGIVSSPDYHFGSDGGRVAYTLETPTRPGDVYVAELPAAGGGRLDATRLTRANPRVEEKSLAAPELVRWTSDDGTEIEGLLWLPPETEEGSRAAEWSRPGAFVVNIHGGPAGVFTRSFDTDVQVLAAHGYAVLQPNVRGSSGYGDAFLRGNMEDIGGGDYRDVMTGVDRMLERGVAHSDSLAVKGWSYGGILGGWTITRTDRFEAASLGAMVSDWPGEFGQGFHYDVVRWYLGGDPWSNGEFWDQRSSYTHMDRVETPTILFHGEEDRIDTMGQSMNFHMALRWFDVPTRFIRFPREGHGISEPRHDRTRRIEELRWLQKWVRGDQDWTAPERPGNEEGEQK